jgi:flagellar hook-length control protein FliK
MSDQVAAPAAAPQTQAPPGKDPAGADPPTLTADFALALAQVAQAPPDEPAQTTRTAKAEGEKAGSDSSAAAPKKTLDAALPDVLALAALVPAAPQETVAPTAAAPVAAPAGAPASAPVAIAPPVETAIPAGAPAAAAEEKPIVGAPAAPPAHVAAAAPAQTVLAGSPAPVAPQLVAAQRTATPTAAPRPGNAQPDTRKDEQQPAPPRQATPTALPAPGSAVPVPDAAPASAPAAPPAPVTPVHAAAAAPAAPTVPVAQSVAATPDASTAPVAPPAPAQPPAAPATPAPAPQVQQPQQPVPLADLARAAQTAIRVTAANGDASATIVLHPQELGTVSIRLHYASGGLTASVRADTPQAAQALQQSAPELRRALHDQGLTLLDLDVRDRGTNRDPGQPRAKRATAADRGVDEIDPLSLDVHVDPARLPEPGRRLDVLA